MARTAEAVNRNDPPTDRVIFWSTVTRLSVFSFNGCFISFCNKKIYMFPALLLLVHIHLVYDWLLAVFRSSARSLRRHSSFVTRLLFSDIKLFYLEMNGEFFAPRSLWGCSELSAQWMRGSARWDFQTSIWRKQLLTILVFTYSVQQNVGGCDTADGVEHWWKLGLYLLCCYKTEIRNATRKIYDENCILVALSLLMFARFH